MYKYYIPHELKVGDITHLADNDSEFAISSGVKVEDAITVETYKSVFHALVTDISKRSVEVEIVEKVEDRKAEDIQTLKGVTIIQSISSPKKFGFFLEKCVEIGIENVIPLLSDLCIVDKRDFEKEMGLYRKIISDATEQSRNPKPTNIFDVMSISDLSPILDKDSVRICLATENTDSKNIAQIVTQKYISDRSIYIAIGPESGWSVNDINEFKKNAFQFVELKGNILRTETAGLVIGSIVKFSRGEI
ncbi:RNA methyltransferase [Candidatus Dojkabacteria bacterium]|nr:RNA methyltransferase [Candidatus Dojkabacteria bacterium]